MIRCKRAISFLAFLTISMVSFGAPQAYINDQADLLREASRQTIEEMARDLHQKTNTYFLLLTESKEKITDFDDDAREVFSNFIQDIPDYRGIMLYIQVEKGTDRGKIRFSSGYGLRGIFEFEAVRKILKEEILKFREDLSNQQPLINGIQSYFKILIDKEVESVQGGSGGFMEFLSGEKILWLVGLLIVSLCIGSVLFLYSKTKCPRCNSRLHINIRPLYKSESPYKRIKIIKCFDCNYFRKYLF